MAHTNPSDKSESADRTPTNANATIALSRAEHSVTGALDLEYPESAGLYGELFERYVPEIVDELIDTRSVRMLVEMEFNARRVQRMFDQLTVGQEARLALELVRRDVEALLWAVCDALSEAYREQRGYGTAG